MKPSKDTNIDISDQAWSQMHTILEKEMPKSNNKLLYFWWILNLVFLLSLSLLIAWNKTFNSTNEQQKTPAIALEDEAHTKQIETSIETQSMMTSEEEVLQQPPTISENSASPSTTKHSRSKHQIKNNILNTIVANPTQPTIKTPSQEKYQVKTKTPVVAALQLADDNIRSFLQFTSITLLNTPEVTSKYSNKEALNNSIIKRDTPRTSQYYFDATYLFNTKRRGIAFDIGLKRLYSKRLFGIIGIGLESIFFSNSISLSLDGASPMANKNYNSHQIDSLSNASLASLKNLMGEIGIGYNISNHWSLSGKTGIKYSTNPTFNSSEGLSTTFNTTSSVNEDLLDSSKYFLSAKRWFPYTRLSLHYNLNNNMQLHLKYTYHFGDIYDDINNAKNYNTFGTGISILF